MLQRLIVIAVGIFFSSQLFAGPKIEHWRTKNGARVFFVAAPELPMVDVRLVFDAGASRDGDKPGLALLTNAVLAEGTQTMNADQIAERFDELGAQFSNGSEREMASLNLRSLSEPETLNKAVDMLAAILRQPAFPQEAFEREKNRLLVALKSKKQDPGEVAEEAFYHAIYGEHPYHAMPEGTEESVAKLTAKDVKEFHQRYYVAGNAVVAVVGALNRKNADKLVNRLLGKLTQGETPPKVPQVNDLNESVLTEIAHPSTQTHVLVGQPGISRKDKDYFALYVGNHVLGGSGLVSRISDEIREKRGLAYSSYSYFLPMANRGPFQMGLQTRNDQAAEALRLLLQTLKGFMEKGPTAAELELAKKNITGGFALRIDSNKSIADYLSVIGFYGLSTDYLDTFIGKVNAVTAKDIQAAFANRINTEKLAVVIVGGSQQAQR